MSFERKWVGGDVVGGESVGIERMIDGVEKRERFGEDGMGKEEGDVVRVVVVKVFG